MFRESMAVRVSPVDYFVNNRPTKNVSSRGS